MNDRKLFVFFAYASLGLLFFVVVVHLHFVILPVSFLALGFLSYLWSGRKALRMFLFLLPLINSTPDVFFNGYPFNYMGIALFYLSGLMLASHLKKEKAEFDFPGRRAYRFFLIVTGVSVFFVFLRWSNLTVSLLAFLRDTPVAPSGERVSFAAIFPAITLALFSLAPFLAAAVRHWRFEEKEIFIPLKAGFCLSFLLALAQKWLDPDLLAQSWWGLRMNQLNGGFSDFNAFGFFAGAMFFYQSLRLTERSFRGRDEGCGGRAAVHHSGNGAWWPEVLFLLIALAAIFVSGCRTAFLFVLLAVAYLIFSRKTRFRFKALVVLLLFLSLLVAGGTLKKRLQQSFVQTWHIADAADMFRMANVVSSGRLAMLRDGALMIGRFPVGGVGAGNFLFYLKYLHYGENAYMDLPLNQYLLFFSETGLAGGLLFLLFLAALLKRQKKGPMHSVTAAIAFALLFNNFFWFPECLLLFWIFLAASDYRAAPERKLEGAFLWALVPIFIVFQLLDFRSLQPLTWARQSQAAFDYGFWPLEKNEHGRFAWTRAAAGKYVSNAVSRDFAIAAAAPSGWLQNKKITVELFWRGKRLQRLVFSENQLKKITLPPGQEGFLEIRVHPTFNIKALQLGEDGRDLGVQFLEMERPRP
ncbi:MAG TPA: O-antigen ligase family protein [Candidatus Binatia bacterium]|nr:O-antigen ligase family protein [Candidatus Binatia bacterium]